MYCTTQGVYRNRVSVYICMFEAVEYEASENVTPCSGCFNKWCFSVWNLRRLNDGRRDINNVCRRTTFSRECIPVGCVPPASVAVSGVGVHSEGVCPGEGCVQGEGCVGGCLPRGVYIPITCWDTHLLPLWREWMTDRCKNITFPQLRLRAVKIISREKRSLRAIAQHVGGNNSWDRVKLAADHHPGLNLSAKIKAFVTENFLTENNWDLSIN